MIRVAVLGSGLSGLVAAYLLALQRDEGGQAVFEVLVFERGDRIGLDAHTLVLSDGRRIETPMRAAQGGYYRRLLKLYEHLGIAQQTIPFDYCISEGSEPLFQYEGGNGLRWNPVSRPAKRRRRDFVSLIAVVTLSYLYVTLWAAWHWLRGHYNDLSHPLHRTTLRDWCDKRWVPRIFRGTILYPLFAAVCTAPMTVVEQTPAADVLEYIIKTFGALHYLSDMSQVVSKLLEPIPKSNVHLSFDVAFLEPLSAGGVMLHSREGQTIEVAHVVSCTPSPVAARLSRSMAKALEASGASSRAVEAEYARADLLSRFSTRQATVVNHRDAAGADLPAREEERRILNLSLPNNGAEQVSATHNIDSTLYQTTNPRSDIDSSLVLSEATFERAVCTIDSRQALAELWQGDAQGLHGLWLAGSWASKGIPLLEGCASSAERVVQLLCERQDVHCSVPW